jgi:AAA15 family ATPase/GTPase
MLKIHLKGRALDIYIKDIIKEREEIKMKFNLNDEIKFKPTERGLAILKQDTRSVEGENLEDVINTLYHYDGEYMRTTLWNFTNTFGKYFIMGIKDEDYPCNMNVEIYNRK